ncbi:hypothetical protein TrispH2_007761 [Trichoplax sp. H2]|nr:hypothetical protein TrispH2_007761 [Trichoplax sp. H2]|eukprot:RDD39913.1 hypothetical protein TrispH2_007761 [Trichoplax sp. H2]
MKKKNRSYDLDTTEEHKYQPYPNQRSQYSPQAPSRNTTQYAGTNGLIGALSMKPSFKGWLPSMPKLRGEGTPESFRKIENEQKYQIIDHQGSDIVTTEEESTEDISPLYQTHNGSLPYGQNGYDHSRKSLASSSFINQSCDSNQYHWAADSRIPDRFCSSEEYHHDKINRQNSIVFDDGKLFLQGPNDRQTLSLQDILKLRRGNPEEILLSLGFGGSLPTDDVITSILNRIPPRFQGIDIATLLNSLKLSSRIKDGVFGVPHHFHVRVSADDEEEVETDEKQSKSKCIPVGDYVDLKHKGHTLQTVKSKLRYSSPNLTTGHDNHPIVNAKSESHLNGVSLQSSYDDDVFTSRDKNDHNYSPDSNIFRPLSRITSSSFVEIDDQVLQSLPKGESSYQLIESNSPDTAPNDGIDQEVKANSSLSPGKSSTIKQLFHGLRQRSSKIRSGLRSSQSQSVDDSQLDSKYFKDQKYQSMPIPYRYDDAGAFSSENYIVLDSLRKKSTSVSSLPSSPTSRTALSSDRTFSSSDYDDHNSEIETVTISRKTSMTSKSSDGRRRRLSSASLNDQIKLLSENIQRNDNPSNSKHSIDDAPCKRGLLTRSHAVCNPEYITQEVAESKQGAKVEDNNLDKPAVNKEKSVAWPESREIKDTPEDGNSSQENAVMHRQKRKIPVDRSLATLSSASLYFDTASDDVFDKRSNESVLSEGKERAFEEIAMLEEALNVYKEEQNNIADSTKQYIDKFKKDSKLRNDIESLLVLRREIMLEIEDLEFNLHKKKLAIMKENDKKFFTHENHYRYDIGLALSQKMLNLLQDQQIMEENLEKIYSKLQEEESQHHEDGNDLILPPYDDISSHEILDEVFDQDEAINHRAPLSKELQSELHLLKKTLELERGQIKHQLTHSLQQEKELELAKMSISNPNNSNQPVDLAG